MEIIAHPERGLFPHPKEIKLNCSCPDYADMCKHVAAVLYGVGARIDERPEELFLLRQADHAELIAKAGKASINKKSTNSETQVLAGKDLSSIFGIDIEGGAYENTGLVAKKKILKPAAKKPKKIAKTNKKLKISKPPKRKNTEIRIKPKISQKSV